MKEIIVMRDRVRAMRRELVDRLKKRIPTTSASSCSSADLPYSGLTREQMITMRERYSVYGIESGRICNSGAQLEEPRLRRRRDRGDARLPRRARQARARHKYPLRRLRDP